MTDMSLKQLVARTAEAYPWYKALLVQTGASGNELKTLPLLNQEILTEHYYNAPLGEGPIRSCLTSGTSSGKRKRILWSDNDHRIYVQQRMSIIKAFCGEKFKRACADLGTGHAAASAGEIFHAMNCEVELIDFAKPIAKHIAVLNRFKPEIFFTMPMILDSLIGSGALDFQPQRIILLGDVASSAWQKRVANYFHISTDQILDLMGSIEVGSIAFYNHAQDYYEFDPWLLPEVLPPKAIYPEASCRGKAGILVLTSFARESFPAVRYVTNDLIEGFVTRQRDGKTIYTFERCLGRFAAEYKHGERISLNDINDVMTKHFPFSKFDLDDSDGALTIRVATDALRLKTIKKIKAELLALNPDVAQMIGSGLVNDISIQEIDEQQVSANMSKRRY